MKTASLLFAGACAAAALAAGAAQAQPAPTGAGPRATLYESPNFQGRSITIYRGDANLGDSNFNDVAQSGRFDGDWTVCTDSNFRGQCQHVSGDVANLNQFGMGRSVSSLQQEGGADRYGERDQYDRDHGDRDYREDRGYTPGGAYPPQGGGGGFYPSDRYGYSGGVSGRSVVFFARPQSNGQDIAAYDRSSADWFCRRQGLGTAVYYDVSQRGRGFRWQGGGFAVNAPVLRDVLCRRY